MVKVLIADDHALVRLGIVELVRQGLAEAEIEQARDGDEALRIIQSANWDVVILDINMPGRSGVEVLREAQGSQPDLPISMLTMHASATYLRRGHQAGAAGFVSEDAAPDELGVAIASVLQGQRYSSTDIRALVN